MAKPQQKRILNGPGSGMHHVVHDGDRFLITDVVHRRLVVAQKELSADEATPDHAYIEHARDSLGLALYADRNAVHYIGEIFSL